MYVFVVKAKKCIFFKIRLCVRVNFYEKNAMLLYKIYLPAYWLPLVWFFLYNVRCLYENLLASNRVID